MRFSTACVQPALRRDAWLQCVGSHCVPFASEHVPRDIEASMDLRRVGRFSCARIVQTSSSLLRSRREIEKSDLEEIFVLLQLSGRSHLEQSGRTAQMSPGAVTIIHSSRPCRFVFDGKNVQLAFHLPAAVATAKAMAWESRLATVFDDSTNAAIGALLRSTFESADPRTRSRGEVVADAIAGLLATCLEGDSWKLGSEHEAGEELLSTVQLYVLAHLGDSGLSPEVIAAAHGISERTLHRMFGPSGHSVCRWIRQSRLDRCAADLADPRMRSQSISQIAFRWGFNDAAHFSTVFRAEYSLSPREYRLSTAPRTQKCALDAAPSALVSMS